MLPISNICFSVGFTVAERVLYIPSIGACAILARMACLWPGQGRLSRGLACMVMLAWYASWTRSCLRHSHAWWTAESLYRAGIEANPRNEKLHDLLATRLQNAGGNLEEALWHAQEAIRINPDYWHAHATLGQLKSAAGQRSDAIASYEAALSLAERQQLDDVADAPKVRLNLAVQLQDVDRKAAERHFRKLFCLPGTDALRAMGLVIFGAFLESGARGQRRVLEDAASAYEEALRSPGLEQRSSAHLRLGSVIRRLALTSNQNSTGLEGGDSSPHQRSTFASACSSQQKPSVVHNSLPRSLRKWWQGLWTCSLDFMSKPEDKSGGKEMDLVLVEPVRNSPASNRMRTIADALQHLCQCAAHASSVEGAFGLLNWPTLTALFLI